MEQNNIFHKIPVIWITTIPINYNPSISQTQRTELRQNASEFLIEAKKCNVSDYNNAGDYDMTDINDIMVMVTVTI
jgi:hypothetical protein